MNHAAVFETILMQNQIHLCTFQHSSVMLQRLRYFSRPFIGVLAAFIFSNTLSAKTLTYAEAEQQYLSQSYTTLANQALQQAAQLEAESVKNLGMPRVDLNVRAYAFQSQVDIPLKDLKNNLEHSLSTNVGSQIEQWENSQNLPSNITNPLKNQVQQGIQNGIGMIPNSANFTIEDQVVRPTVSVVMPLFTGGLIRTSKDIAQLKSQRSQLNSQQQENLQRYELIQAYFDVQLQHQLLQSSQSNVLTSTRHYQNALKLEQQGFISKGQRMQFEVVKNNAERQRQTIQANLESSVFRLSNLLQQDRVDQLTTPLFINTSHDQSLVSLLNSFPEHSALIRKMQMDARIADANVELQHATKRPNLFAFGEYGLDQDHNWIVGVAARYNLFSGVDKNKNIRSAELQRQAVELMTSRTKQETENLIYRAYNELRSAQQSHLLLQQNMKAAQENLRIQELSFKESMGTATQVIDAQNMLNALESEKALNAYRYIMALATLLESHGSIDQFQNYVNQPNTIFIR